MSITKGYCTVFICRSVLDMGIPEDVPIWPSDENVFEMRYETEYSIKILNHLPRPARATVYVDGLRIAVVRIGGNSVVTLRRPADVAGVLTFARAAPVEGAEDPNVGRVRVVVQHAASSSCAPNDSDGPDVMDVVEVENPPIVDVLPVDVPTVRPCGRGGCTVFGRPCTTQRLVPTTSERQRYYTVMEIDALLVERPW